MIGRLLEAIAVGIIFPSFQTVLLTITPHSERGRVMGTAGLVMGSALAVGPIISGVLLTWFPWQALFLFFLVVSLLVLAVSTVTISSVMPLQPTQLDWVSFLLSASFPILLYALGALSKKGLTVGVVGLLILGVLAAGIFVVRQLNRQPPMLQMRVFATGMFTKAVFLTGISYVGLIVTTILMPLYFQTLLGLSPLISGLSLVPAAVLLSILNPISGRLLDRFGPRVVAMIGMLLITGGFGLLAVFAHHLPLIGAIMLAMATEAGNAFVMMPSVTAGANALPNELVADGTAVTTTARQLFGSAGVMFATVLLDGMQTTLRSHAGGFAVTFAVFAGVGLIGLLLALTLPKEVAKKAV
ncbi:Permease of the major facilitator superfamily (fragment) (plasmid) [Latilactobacillus sakei]